MNLKKNIYFADYIIKEIDVGPKLYRNLIRTNPYENRKPFIICHTIVWNSNDLFILKNF